MPDTPEDRDYKLEVKKYQLAVKSYRLDFVSKIGVPVGLLVIAAATYFSNVQSTQEHFAFERDTKQKELLQKEQELFMRQSESDRGRRIQKAAFIAKVMESEAYKSPDANAQIEHLARAQFASTEVDEVLADIKRIRLASPVAKVPVDTSVEAEAKPTDFKKLGLDQQQANNYSQALASFQALTSLSPNDAQAWMYRAYAEYRLRLGEAALRSISTAINLHPTEQRLKELVVINAAKILCLNGRAEESAGYMGRAIEAIPEVQRVAMADAELTRECKFSWNSR